MVDPLTKKTRKNKGELPQYYVENTHEAIIDKETFDTVQEEIKRRRSLGVFANWSINTTCFTSKVKCSKCGMSYRRSGKRQRKNPDEVYYVWICRSKSDKGAKACSAKTIPEKTLKQCCTTVLGLSEFDEDMRRLMKERWTDERKQEMSDKMKKIRSEKYWASTGK